MKIGAKVSVQAGVKNLLFEGGGEEGGMNGIGLEVEW